MADFPDLQYSNKQIVKAGKALEGNLYFTDENKDRVIEIFHIAHGWRDSHALPMRSIRSEVNSRMKKIGVEGIVVGRLKRMPSIRDKLRRLPYNLNQMQDLGGVRAITPSMEDLNRISKEMLDNSRNHFYSKDDYIADPKRDGYRSLHIIFKFQGHKDSKKFDGRRIEIQFRTRLQHSWATAVEAIGLINNENMKAGKGDPDWLRLFKLVSAEFALAEGCPEAIDVPRREERVREIKNLNDRLRAIDTLENLRQAARALDVVDFGIGDPTYYLVEYDH